jgi:hypothetical protein
MVYEPLWYEEGMSKHSKKCPRNALYAHYLRYAGIWCVRAYVCDGQSAVTSAGSDGSVRTGFTSCLSDKIRTNYAYLTASQSIVELFRVLKVSATRTREDFDAQYQQQMQEDTTTSDNNGELLSDGVLS